MKASRCLIALAARLLGVLTATVVLVQCSMPPQQAWRSIQTNGLLPYLAASRPSPPFRAGSSYSQRYSAYPQRSSTASSNWFSNWNSGTPNRYRYGSANSNGYAANNYFSPPSSSAGGSRYVPRSRPSSPRSQISPRVRLPVEEPSPAPQVTSTPEPATSTPKTTGSTFTPAATDALPYGSAVPGRMNMVNSPFAGKTQLVDVSGMSAGQTVKCPYSGKLFKVPPTQQAANHTESRLDSKGEASKVSDEPKAGDKKP